MKPHEKILQMLENVDPSDHKTLDEIDARVQIIADERGVGWVMI